MTTFDDSPAPFYDSIEMYQSEEKYKKMWQDLTNFFKAIVRPYIICSSWTAILLMWLQEIEIPPILLGVGLTILGEYGLERAVKRLKGK